MSDNIKCPKCQSTQLTANKKGFSGGKAAAGALLTGGVGLLAGTIGKDDIVITCIACGNQWEPKNYQSEALKHQNLKEGGRDAQFIQLYNTDKTAAEAFYQTHYANFYSSADNAYKYITKQRNKSLYAVIFMIVAFLIVLFMIIL